MQMTVAELKAECKDRNLKATGTKAVMAQRLLDRDQTFADEQARFKVYIKTLSGSVYTIYTESDITIHRLKELIEQERGVPIGQQRLVLLGDMDRTITDDGRTLADYGIRNGAFLQLHIRL